MWLYKLTNKINGKAYIGTSVNPIAHRISRHLYAANSGRKDMAIACAIRKYGLDEFEVECLDHADSYEQLLQMEVEAIKQYGTLLPSGYNITEGGRGACRPCSEETRAKISAKAKGRVCNQETKAKLSKALKGKPQKHPKLGTSWNAGKTCPSISAGIQRSFEAGREVWNKGTKMGPMSEDHKKQIAETMKQVRAAQFWSTKSKGNYDDQTIQ